MAKNRVTLEELFDKALLFVPSADDSLSLQDVQAGERFKPQGGVYTFYNALNIPLYVGISGNVRKRTVDHFHEGSGNYDLYRYITAGNKGYVKVFYVENKAFQEVYESYLIETLQPRYNVAKTGRIKL